MIELKLKDLDTPSGETLVTYNIEGLTTDDILTIGDIGYSTTFKNSKVKLELEETDSLELFAVHTYEDELGEPIPKNKLYTEIYLDISETSDLIYIGRAKGNLTEEPNKLLKMFNKWLSSKKVVTEDLDESVEDSAWGEEEVRAELIRLTNNFKKNEGEITTWYEEEKDHIKNILEAASYQVEISDGRKNKDEDMNWVITFVKKVNESLTENLSEALTLKLLFDEGEDESMATFSVEEGKDFILDSVKKIGWGKGTRVPTIDPPADTDIVKLEVFTITTEDDETEVFIDINENLDLIYCGKFEGLDYTNVDKIIEVIKDWSNDAAIEESLKEDSNSIDEIAELCGGHERVEDIVNETRENYPGIDCDELAEMTYHLCDSGKVSEDEWASLIEYVCSHLEESLKEDTNISIDKVEIDVDTLNTKTKKIDEDLAFDKDKKLTIREMYDFLLKSGMANGCDIILDWDNDSDLSDPKTAIEWLDLIIETYYDLDSDLRYMNANDEAERNMDQVIVPLEDFRNELNEKGLAQLNNIYYQVLSYNNDSGDDDFDDYDNYGVAETAFENWVNDYKEDGVDGAVELLQVDDNKGTSKQLKYWSSEDDNAWKFDESISDDEETDYGCDKCGKRVSEDKIHWFYGAEVGLCNDCHDKMTDEERYQLDDGDFSSLEEANKTKAQRHNDMMNKVFDNAKKQNQILKDILKDNGVSEEEIGELEKATGLHGSALHKKVYDLGLNNEFAKRLGLKESLDSEEGTWQVVQVDREDIVPYIQRFTENGLKTFTKDGWLYVTGDVDTIIDVAKHYWGFYDEALYYNWLSPEPQKIKELRKEKFNESITEDHLTLDGDTLDIIKDFINDAFEYMREDEVELSDEVTLYATPTRDRENNQEVTFDVIENDVILDSVVGYPGNTEYCYETITSILREQTGLVKMSESKEESEDKATAYSEILNAKIKVNPNRHPADEKMFCGTYFIGTYEEGGLAGQEYVFVLADSEGHRFMNEYMGYPKDKDGYVDQPTDVITLNGQDNVYFMVEPEELFKEKVEESIVMNENASDPDFDAIEQALMGIRGTAKVEFDYRPHDGVYKKPQDHFIVLVFEDDLALEEETTLNIFNDATAYFKNRKQWKLDVINKLKELGWKLEDPIEDNSSYLYLVMEKIKPEAKTEGYETLDGNKVEVYSDYETAKSRALMLGLKEADYGDEFGSDVSYCAWNKSGDRNEEVEVLAYYKFENGKPVALTDEEKATVENVKEITFDDITGPIDLN